LLKFASQKRHLRRKNGTVAGHTGKAPKVLIPQIPEKQQLSPSILYRKTCYLLLIKIKAPTD
jgi:hypothetical protein